MHILTKDAPANGLLHIHQLASDTSLRNETLNNINLKFIKKFN